MRLESELINDTSSTLIIGNPKMLIVHQLVSELKRSDVQVLISTYIPDQIPENITRIFCFCEVEDILHDFQKLPHKRSLIFICVVKKPLDNKTEQTLYFMLKHNEHVKIAFIPRGEHEVSIVIRKLLLLTFSNSKKHEVIHAKPDPIYHKEGGQMTISDETDEKYPNPPLHIRILKNPKKTLLSFLFSVLLLHLAFFVPLIMSLLIFGYQLLGKVSIPNLPLSETITARGKSIFALSRQMYEPVKRGWLFVGLAKPLDGFFDSLSSIIDLEETARHAKSDAGIMISRMLDPGSDDTDQIYLRKESLKLHITKIRNDLITLEANLPIFLTKHYSLDDKITKYQEYLDIAEVALDRFDDIFGKNGPKMYALFFANNHELRPGGGFIGSFALIKAENLKIVEWKVYDVYDADGQLKARVRPPEAISKYLRQPFFFLRDSAFSPDSPTNAIIAEDFLQKELGINNLDGAVTLTFSSIENIIRTIGPIYISEYNTTLNYENAYHKTQSQAETNFFPGSTAKKDFLDSLFAEIMLKFSEPETAAKILLSVRSSFDEKRIVAYMKDVYLQEILDKYQWSGRQISPTCINSQSLTEDNCKAIYIFPVEANLGVNKANAYVRRTYALNTVVSEDGTIVGEFVTKFTNSSTVDIEYGGPYKNYYQIYLPPNTTILTLKVDNSIASSYDVENTNYTRVGYFLTVPQNQSVNLTLRFRLDGTLPSNGSALQILIQKQVGLPSSDITLRFGLPTNYVYSSANFSPLALQDVLEYNSSVDSDKIYYLNF